MRNPLALFAALVLAAPAAALSQAAKPLDDATIVAIFDNANTVDIETGKLAMEKGATAKVRDFGKMIAGDHANVRQLGRDLAKKLGVTPTPPAGDAAAKSQAAVMQKLRGLSGKAFDRAFLQHEVEFHAGVINAVNSTLLPAISNAELKALVVKAAPAFLGHQKAAEALLKDY